MSIKKVVFPNISISYKIFSNDQSEKNSGQIKKVDDKVRKTVEARDNNVFRSHSKCGDL